MSEAKTESDLLTENAALRAKVEELTKACEAAKELKTLVCLFMDPIQDRTKLVPLGKRIADIEMSIDAALSTHLNTKG